MTPWEALSRFAIPGQVGRGDKTQVTIMFVNVYPVPKYIFVRDIETNVIHGHRDFPTACLVEQYTHFQAFRLARLEHFQHARQGPAGVHDVLNEQNVQSFNIGVQVEVDAHIPAGGVTSHAIGGQRHAVQGVRDSNIAGQVSGEGDPAAQQADDQQFFALVILADLGAEL